MNKEYAKVTIEQTSDNGIDIDVSGNIENLLKSLAATVAQVVTGLPKSQQQHFRARFLGYLNQATVDEYRKEM
jgi:phage terminase Nu1 subunit (DNA packaging protein)